MTSKTTNRFSPEVRRRAVRLPPDHEHEHPPRWAPVESVAAKIGSRHRANEWVKRQAADHAIGRSRTAEGAERENREPRQVNEICGTLHTVMPRSRSEKGFFTRDSLP